MNTARYHITFLLILTACSLFAGNDPTKNENPGCAGRSNELHAGIKGCEPVLEGMDGRPSALQVVGNDSAAYLIKPANINTPGAELGTFFFRDGIIFSSTSWSGTLRDKRYSPDELPSLDLYFSKELAPARFSEPVAFAPTLKTRFNDGPVTWDPLENLLYITRYVPQGANRRYDQSNLHLQVVVAEERGEEWVFREDFFLNGPDVSIAHPSVSPDGQLIFFASDMPEGYGGYDIYFCFKKDNNTWSEPYNIGPFVNSEGDELFPFADSRGFLYFSSDGHPGLGGQDIFLATAETGVYNTIKNLGKPVNSPNDDVALVLAPNSERGYFSSNRETSRGYYDIYSVVFNRVQVTLRGIIKDLNHKSVLADTNVKILDAEGKTVRESTTGTDGSFSFVVNKTVCIRILIEKQGYEPLLKPLNLQFLQSDEEMVLEVFIRKE